MVENFERRRFSQRTRRTRGSDAGRDVSSGEDTCGSRGPRALNEDRGTAKREHKGRSWGVRSESEAAPSSSEAPGSRAKASLLFPGEQTCADTMARKGACPQKDAAPLQLDGVPSHFLIF